MFERARDSVCNICGEDVAGNVRGISVARGEVWVDWRGDMVVELDQLILGTDGVAGSGVVQDREPSDPTPAIRSDLRPCALTS